MYAMRTWRVTMWRAILPFSFFLLCLRFQISAVRSAGVGFGLELILIVGGLTLGYLNPSPALFAFTMAVPLLSGLSQTGLLTFTFAPSLVFSALWLGITGKYLLQNIMELYPSPILLSKHCQSFFTHFIDTGLSDNGSNTPRSSATTELRQQSYYSHLLVIDTLIAALLLSLAWQLCRHLDSGVLWPALINRAVLGYGDPLYFLTASFVWLQGLFYFRTLFAMHIPQWTRSINANADVLPFTRWLRPVFAVYGVTMTVFLIFQYVFHNPEGWAAAGFQSPYEDISSFGSVAVSVFIFAVATGCVSPWRKLAANIIGCVCLLVMVAASWSRAAWLAGFVFLLLIAALRLSRMWTVAFILLAVTAVAGINASSSSPFWRNQPYLVRLVSLVRLESPTNKDSGRLNLYWKAGRMIRNHPIFGNGIGSFYLTSVKYAHPNDPYASKPDFAHNVFLQIAVEEGVPIATLFAGLVACILWRGLRRWLRERTANPRCSADALLILSVTLALGAYIETQMTANSLNVYVSNQFFFWFLIASILAMSEHEQDSRTAPAAFAKILY